MAELKYVDVETKAGKKIRVLEGEVPGLRRLGVLKEKIAEKKAEKEAGKEDKSLKAKPEGDKIMTTAKNIKK